MEFRVYEFEVIDEGDMWTVMPYDLPGATQGVDFEDACLMAADWLRLTVEDAAMHGKALPEPTFGNEPRHGGRTVVVGVAAGTETVERVTAADAARALGVTRARVSQMLASRQLDGWREGHSSYVTRDSLDAALGRDRRAGRPRVHEEE